VTDSVTCLAFKADSGYTEFFGAGAIHKALQAPHDVLYFDVSDPTSDEFAELAQLLNLHPLAIEDACKARQRPKIESYANFWFIVMHNAKRNNGELFITDLSLFCGENYIVAVHDPADDVRGELQRRWSQVRHESSHLSASILYAIFDSAVDAYLPIAEAFENEVDRLEEGLFTKTTPTQPLLLEVFYLRRDIAVFKNSVLPVHDILGPIVRGEFHGFSSDAITYFRDIDDHISRVMTTLDSAKEALMNAREMHLAFASHRQNEVMKQLSVVSTIFLHLTFITGFFGQNFGWMTEHITSVHSFAYLGIALDVLVFLGLIGYFRAKRWF
jgi:magnesium transporter